MEVAARHPTLASCYSAWEFGGSAASPLVAHLSSSLAATKSAHQLRLSQACRSIISQVCQPTICPACRLWLFQARRPLVSQVRRPLQSQVCGLRLPQARRPRLTQARQPPLSQVEPDESSNFAAAWNNLLVRLARGELAPRLSLVSPKVFFSPFCHRWEFWFLAAVASGLLSWGHLISSDIVDLFAQILFKLN